MTLPEILLLVAAGFGAGVINTIAGGGTFLTFPALVFSGVPPVIANATSTVSVFPGYLSGAAGFLPELRAFRRAELLRLTAPVAAWCLWWRGPAARFIGQGVFARRAVPAARGDAGLSPWR